MRTLSAEPRAEESWTEGAKHLQVLTTFAPQQVQGPGTATPYSSQANRQLVACLAQDLFYILGEFPCRFYPHVFSGIVILSEIGKLLISYINCGISSLNVCIKIFDFIPWQTSYILVLGCTPIQLIKSIFCEPFGLSRLETSPHTRCAFGWRSCFATQGHVGRFPDNPRMVVFYR